MSTQQLVEKKDELPEQTAEVSVEGFLQAAIEKGIDPDGLEKLVNLQERILDRNAEMQFNEAMHKFQSKCKAVMVNSTAKTNKFSWKYASLDHIATTIQPWLDECGLSYKFERETKDNKTDVICVAKHIGGHKEKASFPLLEDVNAVVNDMQKHASANNYAKRQALTMVLGITVTEFDDDANTAGKDLIDENQKANIETLMEEVKANTKAFLKACKIESIEKMPVRKYQRAIKMLEAKRKQ